MRRLTHDTYTTLFGFAYLFLVTNLLLVLSCLPAVALLMATDPARSWPLILAVLPLCAPGLSAAHVAFREYADGGAPVLRAFTRGWRATAKPALRLALASTAIVLVLLVDVRALAGTAAGVLLIPLLAVLALTVVAVGMLGLVAIAEEPRARVRDVARVSAYLACRHWCLTLASLVVLATQVALFTAMPAVALGLTAAPALYLTWANSRYSLRPAIPASRPA